MSNDIDYRSIFLLWQNNQLPFFWLGGRVLSLMSCLSILQFRTGLIKEKRAIRKKSILIYFYVLQVHAIFILETSNFAKSHFPFHRPNNNHFNIDVFTRYFMMDFIFLSTRKNNNRDSLKYTTNCCWNRYSAWEAFTKFSILISYCQTIT